MTDLEKIAYAKSFIDKLAKGIDPTDDSPIPAGDVAAKARIAGCFSFVSDVLSKLVNSPDTVTNLYRVPERRLTAQVLSSIECTQYPISISAFAQKIDLALRSSKKFTAHDLTPWLMHNGYIEKLIDSRDKSFKRPTQKGIDIGIIVFQSTSQSGRVTQSIRLNMFAQQFIRDHLSEIISFSDNRFSTIGKQLPVVKFRISQAQLSGFAFSQTPLSITEIANMISNLNPYTHQVALKPGDLAQWLVYLGLLEMREYNGKNYKLPTQAGTDIGILVEQKSGMYGDYPLTLYSVDAQRFIIDNIHGLIKVDQ